MRKGNKLIEKIVSSLDWESILEVNRCFKIGVGEGTSVIPGIKRKSFSDSLTKNDIKAELKILLNHVIDNDIAELFYGPWMIFWMNSEWTEFQLELDNDDIYSSDEPDSDIQFSSDSSLEVIYSPQRIHVVGNFGQSNPSQEESDVTKLETMLKKAIDQENYELATKIKEVISIQNSPVS